MRKLIMHSYRSRRSRKLCSSPRQTSRRCSLQQIHRHRRQMRSSRQQMQVHNKIIIDKKDAAKTIAASSAFYDSKRIQISHGFKEIV